MILENFNIGQFKGGLFIEKAGTASENLRGYYQSDEKSQKHYCLWWHKPYRHWWIGHCSSRGNNHGLAWLEPDVLCPNDSQGPWRRGGSDTVTTGYARIANTYDDYDFSPIQAASSSQSNSRCNKDFLRIAHDQAEKCFCPVILYNFY